MRVFKINQICMCKFVLLFTILKGLDQLFTIWGPLFWFVALCHTGVSLNPHRSTHNKDATVATVPCPTNQYERNHSVYSWFHCTYEYLYITIPSKIQPICSSLTISLKFFAVSKLLSMILLPFIISGMQ